MLSHSYIDVLAIVIPRCLQSVGLGKYVIKKNTVASNNAPQNVLFFLSVHFENRLCFGEINKIKRLSEKEREISFFFFLLFQVQKRK